MPTPFFWCFMISNEIFMQYSDFRGETESSKKKNVQSAPWPFPLPSRQLLPLVWPQPLRRFWEPWVRGRCVNVASLEASQLPLTQQSGSSRCEHEGFGDNTTLYRHFKLYIKFWTTKIANSVQHCSTLFLKYKNAKHFFVAYPKMFFRTKRKASKLFQNGKRNWCPPPPPPPIPPIPPTHSGCWQLQHHHPNTWTSRNEGQKKILPPKTCPKYNLVKSKFGHKLHTKSKIPNEETRPLRFI